MGNCRDRLQNPRRNHCKEKKTPRELNHAARVVPVTLDSDRPSILPFDDPLIGELLCQPFQTSFKIARVEQPVFLVYLLNAPASPSPLLWLERGDTRPRQG